MRLWQCNGVLPAQGCGLLKQTLPGMQPFAPPMSMGQQLANGAFPPPASALGPPPGTAPGTPGAEPLAHCAAPGKLFDDTLWLPISGCILVAVLMGSIQLSWHERLCLYPSGSEANEEICKHGQDQRLAEANEWSVQRKACSRVQRARRRPARPRSCPRSQVPRARCRRALPGFPQAACSRRQQPLAPCCLSSSSRKCSRDPKRSSRWGCMAGYPAALPRHRRREPLRGLLHSRCCASTI